MTVGDFVELAGDDYIFEIVDATKQGNRTFPEKCLFPGGDGAYKWHTKNNFGDLELVGYDIVTKRRMRIYAKGKPYKPF